MSPKNEAFLFTELTVLREERPLLDEIQAELKKRTALVCERQDELSFQFILIEQCQLWERVQIMKRRLHEFDVRVSAVFYEGGPGV